jgi:mono/diheme cytochrome c family protein
MKNFLIVFLIVVFAVNVYGFLFGDDGRSQTNRDFTERTAEARAGNETTANMSLEEGADIYGNNCGSCHGQNGGGFIGPELVENNNLEDTSFVVGRILEGGNGMPAFGRFSDEEIANVTSFIRGSWGNDFGEVSAADVEAER